MPLVPTFNLSSNITNSSPNASAPPFDYMKTCSKFLNLREETPTESGLKVAAYAVAFMLAMIGNILVIVIVLRKNHLKTTTNLFIVNMAFSDVLMALVCMPTTMYSIASKNLGQSITGIAGLIMCKSLPFLQGLAVAVSILTLSTLAADRFLAIVYPFENFISKSRAKILIGLVWFVGFAFNAPLIYAMKFYFEEGRWYCHERWAPVFDENKAARDYTVVLFVFLYAIPLILVTFFYTALIRELWRGKSLHSNKTRALTENKAVLKMVFTVIVAFAICWLPVHVNMFIVLFSNDIMINICGMRPTIIFIGWFLAHVNSSINPIIYFIFNENFRREVVKMMVNIRDFSLRRKRSSRDIPLPVNRRGTTTQNTHNISLSSNEENHTGKNNEAFEMVSENGAAAANGSANLAT
ncbi:QRFP-like peptide receptor [Actinia tenebrosa]|uniref:QRFP-like peptide receptor n=1 Tax=Actinia tenebrosa TaxID=6105 RepID=A0A6P8IZ34_ACTTE|nr:QRFP-like peptide receptor [Actinia tenebrosa]XP_031572769.1 QRFP-like peptide receptor [Actinia tenebrosa]XP_031572770.1 QRFP-like peptide receptor [Actinia tenebrosa]XP_031572771.1 QRFP-like peptide receptor [Actinia tenebrosa]XP_031572772.1 QRFP-like peptide receptor [Actinia tenebrosa]XP_031572774.1 QRFP-like peptide receptor [Actinia tenebrosa]